MDCIVHGILRARILEWVAFPFSRGSSQPRDQTQVSRIAGGFYTTIKLSYTHTHTHTHTHKEVLLTGKSSATDKQEVLELNSLVAIIVKDLFRQETSEC